MAALAGALLLTKPLLAGQVILENPSGWPASADSSIPLGQALEGAGVSGVAADDDLVVSGIIRLDANEPPSELSAASLSIGGSEDYPAGFLSLVGGALKISGDIRLGDPARKPASIIQLAKGGQLQWGGDLVVVGSPGEREKSQVGLRIVGGTNVIEGKNLQVTDAYLEFLAGSEKVWTEFADRSALKLSGAAVLDGATIVFNQVDKQEGAEVPAGEYLLLDGRAVEGEIPRLVLEGFAAEQISKISLKKDERGLSLVVAE